jgi:hypothetical protein
MSSARQLTRLETLVEMVWLYLLAWAHLRKRHRSDHRSHHDTCSLTVDIRIEWSGEEKATMKSTTGLINASEYTLVGMAAFSRWLLVFSADDEHPYR